MLKHGDIWRAIDRLAEINGLSTSGLAREAGLDATTFNKSKRIAPDGKKRWPSTESLAKIMQATDTDFGDFLALVSKSPVMTRIPAIALADVGKKGKFDDKNQPVGPGWASAKVPGVEYADAFGVIVGKGLEPLYRSGDLLIVAPSAEIRKGDRVMALPATGDAQLKTFVKNIAGKVELAPLSGSGVGKVVSAKSIGMLAKIILIRPI